MTKKIKISDAAKDFNVSVQDIVDFFSAKDNKKRNASSSLNEAEMNLLLEHYTKKHEVKNFDSYYQSRNDEKPARKNSGRRNDRNNKQSAQAKKSDKKPETPKKQETPVIEQPKEKAVSKAPETVSAETPKTTEQPKIKTGKKNDKQKTQAKARDRGERSEFNATFSSETAQTSTQRRTVDTRGSYTSGVSRKRLSTAAFSPILPLTPTQQPEVSVLSAKSLCRASLSMLASAKTCSPSAETRRLCTSLGLATTPSETKNPSKCASWYCGRLITESNSWRLRKKAIFCSTIMQSFVIVHCPFCTCSMGNVCRNSFKQCPVS